jgi:mono/diheme cytochrome c family protein
MRSAISLGVFAACMALVLLTEVKSAQSTELASAVAVAAALPPLAANASGHDDEDDGNPIEGRRIYMRENCYVCHGGFVGGGMCPSLRDRRPDVDEVREAVRRGTRNGMPRFPELTEQDIRNVAAYFQTLRTQREPTFTHWWEPVPTQ